MQSSSYQSWYFFWVFGYEYTELILPNLILCLCFWIRQYRAHPGKVSRYVVNSLSTWHGTSIKPCWPSTILVTVFGPCQAPSVFWEHTVNDSARLLKMARVLQRQVLLFSLFLGDERQSDAEKLPGRKSKNATH